MTEGENLPKVDDAYIDCDAHLTTSQIPSISDLMTASDDSGDEDEEEITKVVPTADLAIQSIKQFLYLNVNQEANFQKILVLNVLLLKL